MSQRAGNEYVEGALGELQLGVDGNGLYAPMQANSPPTTMPTVGQKAVAVAGTAEPLAGAPAPLRSGVTVRAQAGNTGDIYVGDEDVDSATGFVLAAGESVFIPIADLASVYVDAEVNGEAVSFIAI